MKLICTVTALTALLAAPCAGAPTPDPLAVTISINDEQEQVYDYPAYNVSARFQGATPTAYYDVDLLVNRTTYPISTFLHFLPSVSKFGSNKAMSYAYFITTYWPLIVCIYRTPRTFHHLHYPLRFCPLLLWWQGRKHHSTVWIQTTRARPCGPPSSAGRLYLLHTSCWS